MCYVWVGRISIKTVGSEDSLVYCIKHGSMAADATAAISAETATLLCDVNGDMNIDPFSSDEEFENKETIVDDH